MTLVVTSISPSEAADYTLLRLGLSDALHTRSDGRQFAFLHGWSASGYAAGYSQSYKNQADFGTSGWWSDGQQILRVGLFDAEHRSDLFPNQNAYFSEALGVNEQGIAVGYSLSYAGQGTLKSAWRFDGSTVTRLGFVDAAHIGDVSQRETIVLGDWMNDAGDVIGYSRRFGGTTNPNITTAWLHRGGQYTELGLTNTALLKPDGRSDSQPVALNPSGTAIGNSEYEGPGTFGAISWIYDGQTTRPIGPVDPDALQSGYWRSSYAQRINQAGQVVGYAHPDGLKPGQGFDAVWFYDGQTTERIGLHGGDYVHGISGYSTGRIDGLSEAGHVIGDSTRWNQGAILGTDAWIYHEGVTTKIGLYGPEYSNTSGIYDADLLQVNDTGFVIGSSKLYVGEDWTGNAPWLFDGLETRRLGHFDPVHTNSAGVQDSSIMLLLPNVGGYSNHYAGATRDGITLWYYDYSDEQLLDILFVPSPSPTAIEGGLTQFSLGGEIYGFADLFSGTTFIDRDLFTWAEAAGMAPLPPRIADGDDRALFEYLLTISHVSPTGVLFGRGQLAGGGLAPFALIPVPEPSNFAACLSAAVAYLLVARRPRRVKG
jgi:hypothetical protein